MKLYVCWTAAPKFGPHKHPCGQAHQALVEAGHDPEVKKAYGWRALPDVFNKTEGRKEVAEESGGDVTVPALKLDDGTFIQGTGDIIRWAEANPA